MPLLFSLMVGAAVQAQDQAPRRALPNQPLATLVADDDYPVEAQRREAEGTVRFMLTIDSQGRPTACTITASSGDAALDQETCRLFVRRARFRPALDAAGRSTTDTFAGSLTWRLPGLEFMPYQFREVVTSYYFTPRGFSHCTEAVNGVPVPRRAGEVCQLGSFLVHFLPAGKRSRQITIHSVLIPAGQRIAPLSKPGGGLAAEEVLDMEIAPDGTIGKCRTKSRNYIRPIPAITGCEAALAGHDRFERSTNASARRLATLILRTYVQKTAQSD